MSKMIDRLEFKFKGLPVCSTNKMYEPTKGKNKGAYLRKSRHLIEWQSKMSKMFESEIFYTKEDLELFKQHVISDRRAVVMYLYVIVPEKEYRSKNDLKVNDISNMIKTIEDCIASNIGLDDKYNTQVIACKSYIEGNNEWMYRVILVSDEPETMFEQSLLGLSSEDYYDLNYKEGESSEKETNT